MKVFPCGSPGKESTCSAGDLGSIPGLGRSLGEGTGNPLQYSCLEHPMDRGAWAGLLFMESQKVEYNSTNTLTWWRVFSFGMPSLVATFGIWFPDQGLNLGHLHCLEEGMATHSSILAWRIPKTQEPGRLQPTGSQRVEHDWSDLAHMHNRQWLVIAISPNKIQRHWIILRKHR